jgi:hypothetical protein
LLLAAALIAQINQRLTEICGISVADHIGRSVRETVPAVAEQVESIVNTVYGRASRSPVSKPTASDLTEVMPRASGSPIGIR